jgi:hypothetical protein
MPVLCLMMVPVPRVALSGERGFEVGTKVCTMCDDNGYGNGYGNGLNDGTDGCATHIAGFEERSCCNDASAPSRTDGPLSSRSIQWRMGSLGMYPTVETLEGLSSTRIDRMYSFCCLIVAGESLLRGQDKLKRGTGPLSRHFLLLSLCFSCLHPAESTTTKHYQQQLRLEMPFLARDDDLRSTGDKVDQQGGLQQL